MCAKYEKFRGQLSEMRDLRQCVCNFDDRAAMSFSGGDGIDVRLSLSYIRLVGVPKPRPLGLVSCRPAWRGIAKANETSPRLFFQAS